MLLNAHCNLSVFIKHGKKMFLLSIQIVLQGALIFFFFNLTESLAQFWESSQKFDLHHPNNNNFTQQDVGQQSLVFEQNTHMLMERQNTQMFLMSFTSQSENGRALIQSAAGRKKDEQYQLVWVSLRKRQTSAAWHSWLGQNKSNIVTWSRVPFHTLDDNNQLNWNPLSISLWCVPGSPSVLPRFYLSDQIKRLLPDDKIVDLDMHMVVLPVQPWQDGSIVLWEKGQQRCRRQLCSSNYDQAETEEAPAFCLQAD